MKHHPEIARACAAKALVLVVAAAIFFSGCTTWKGVSLPTSSQPIALQLNDRVRLHTKNGEQFAFKIIAIEPNAFAGAHVKIKYTDIADLQVRRIHKGHTVLLVSGIVLGTALIAGIVYVSALQSFLAE